MSNRSLTSIISSGSAVILIAAFGAQAFGDSRTCRDLQTDITAIKRALGALDGKVDQSNQSSAEIRLAIGVVDGKVDQSNQSSAEIRLALGVVDGKVDQSNQSSAAIRLALGVLDAKVDRSNADLAIVRTELQWIREALLAQTQVNGGLQLQIQADETSCTSGAIQCASTTLPSSSNQNPVELKLLVLRDQASVTNLEIGDFEMTTAFSPDGGHDVTSCTIHETGCGSPEFFINRGNGGYQLWVHPPTNNWVGEPFIAPQSDRHGRAYDLETCERLDPWRSWDSSAYIPAWRGHREESELIERGQLNQHVPCDSFLMRWRRSKASTASSHTPEDGRFRSRRPCFQTSCS
jgi:hypothetical protein